MQAKLDGDLYPEHCVCISKKGMYIMIKPFGRRVIAKQHIIVHFFFISWS